MAWWGWIVLVVVAALAWIVFTLVYWRRATRRELIVFLARELPEYEVVEERHARLTLREQEGDEVTMNLQNLYAQAAQAGHDPEVREEVFRQFLGAFREAREDMEIDRERDRPRIRPRIVRREEVGILGRQTGGTTLPSVGIGVDGLCAVFVRDSEHSVRYLDQEALDALRLRPDEALDLATRNLADGFTDEPVRQTLDDGALTVIKSMDTYDAARVLLLPALLRDGERIVALIPDRDTLALARPPEDGDWSGLRKLAKNAAGPPLWGKPLLVTKDGIRGELPESG